MSWFFRMDLYLCIQMQLTMKTFFKYYFLAFILFSDFVLFAQPGDNNDGGDLEDNDPPAAPINSKLIWLGIVGVLFALYMYKKRKANFLQS